MISNHRADSDIQGYFTFNSEKYSVNDLVSALLSQGISIHKVGTNLKVGQKIINPIINNPLNYNEKLDDQINQNVIQGLASQIQRIFNELNKLKDHLGINNNIMQDLPTSDKQIFDFSSLSNKDERSESFEMRKKWDNFIPTKNFDLNSETKRNASNDIPIITLGKRKSSSLIDEYTDLVTNKGIPDNEALDSLSSKLFNTVNRSLTGLDNKQDIRSVITNQSTDKSSAQMNEFPTYSFSKCKNCNSKIPNESQFCSKCGNKLNN